MLKKMLYRKIMVASSLLVIIFMLYLIPANNEQIEIIEEVEYVYPSSKSVIYLLDELDYVSRTTLETSKLNEETEAKYLLEALTKEGNKKDIIPKGFKGILPRNTNVLSLELKDKILKINFSKEFNNVREKDEEKLIEALTYTLTSINGIEKIEIYINNEKLEFLPHSKKKLPEYLDKSYGINKKYELTTLNDIENYTVYYTNIANGEPYYIPVTKYINNDNQDKIKVIIDELSTSLIYETNLSSYLDANTKLLDYEILDNQIKLNFNDKILSNITNDMILEEVRYTIGLSLCDEYNVSKVIFNVNDKTISTFVLE